MQDTNVRGPTGECAVASVEARVRSRINIWNCKRKSNKQLGPLKELLGTLQISLLPVLTSYKLNDRQFFQVSKSFHADNFATATFKHGNSG